MRTTYALSFAAFGQYVAAQAFDAAAVAAASPSQVGPATVATTKTYSYSVNTPVASASIAAQLAPASAAAPPSKAFSNEKRQYYNADPVYTVKVCRKKSSSYSPITYVPSTSTGNPYQPTTLTSTITTTISSSTYSPTIVTSTTTTTITTSSSTTSSSTSSSTDITTSTSTTTSDTTTSSSTTETSTTLTTVTTTSTTTTSESACPTQIEDGTFCGFINPQDPCAPQPSSAGGPKVQPDTVDAFLAYPDFETQSENAVTPAGYESVFTNLQGAVAGGSYITFKPLDTYDVQGCADFCDATDLCTSFNIYIERDPSINPSTPANLDPTVFGNDCPNPSSITNYKCTLWGSALSADQATNVGQKRIDFDVVVTGSNGYDKTSTTTPPVQALFAAPVDLKSRAINKAAEFSLGSKFFPGPFDPSLCTLYAAAQTAANKAAAKDSGLSSFSPVNMFNAVYVYKDDVAWGTYCALFDNVLDESYADFAGVIVDGEELKVGQSFTYAREVFDTGRLRK